MASGFTEEALDDSTEATFLTSDHGPPKAITQVSGIEPSVRYWTTVLATLAFTIHGLGAETTQAPFLRLFESVLCRRYYESRQPSLIDDDGAIPEKYCKINAVQGQIAWLDGWQLLFDSCVGILVAIPWGIFADKYGRKWVLFLSMMGLCFGQAFTVLVCYLDLDLRLTWLSCFTLLLGGGMEMASSLYCLILAAVTPHESRISVFYVTEAVLLCTSLVGPSIGSLLLEYGPWIPVGVGVIVRFAGTLIFLMVPNVPSATRSSTSIIGDSNEPDDPPENKTPARFPVLNRFVTSLKVMISNKVLGLLIITFLISGATRSWIQYFLQYVSNRYGWTYAQAGYLLSIRAGFKIIFLLVCLPVISQWLLSRPHMTALQKDLILTRASSTITSLGFFIIATAPNSSLVLTGLVTYCFGIGYRAAARSVVTFVCDPQHLTHLYTSTAVMEMIGMLLSGPVLANLFRLGLELGSVWLGMPFLYTAVLFAIISAIMWSVDASGSTGRSDEYAPDERESLIGRSDES